MAAKGGAAAAAAVPDSEDDSVPCAAPTPQPRCLVPSGGPEVAALTPEREGGILRRHQQRRDKIQPRQVRTAGWVGVATPRHAFAMLLSMCRESLWGSSWAAPAQ